MTEEDRQKRDAREAVPPEARGPAAVHQAHLGALTAFKWLPWRLKRLLTGWTTPSFQVGAGLVVQRGDGAILFVRHSYRGGWGLPGGMLKRNEHPAGAAVRETFEEVGLHVEIDARPVVTIEPDCRRVGVIFRARPISESDAGELVPRSPEILEAAWFPPDQPPVLQREAAMALDELHLLPRPQSS